MARYYENLIAGRTIISTERIEGARIADSVEAACWLEAKRNLSYKLSDKDDDRLDLMIAERDAQ